MPPARADGRSSRRRRGQRSPADPPFQPSAKFELTINQNKIVVAMAVSDIVSSAFDAAGPFEFRKDLTKAQASKLIDEMRKKAGVGDQV